MHIELTGLGFSAAHFIVGHEKCEHLHGHNWSVGATIEGKPDEHGLIVDFLDLRKILEGICKSYDHRLLLPSRNRALRRSSEGVRTRISIHGGVFEFPTEDVVWLPVVNTTVEELARVIAAELKKRLPHPNVRRIRVWVEESPGQRAVKEETMG